MKPNDRQRRAGGRACCALLCLALAAAPPHSRAQAQGRTDTAAQSRMNADAAADFKRTDRDLSVVYARIAPRLPAPTRKRLAAAQKAWLLFRDADARFSAGTKAGGGSMYAMAYDDARTELTRQRIQRLKKIVPPPAPAKTPAPLLGAGD